ncbi:YeiH family protein [Acetobacter indonesiensis]|uniref:YeiH family protein n=1 Tax=Acetobacter indonesiensis TaxID=104101 RepID=UPI0038D1503C
MNTQRHSQQNFVRLTLHFMQTRLPGIALCVGVTSVAYGLESAEIALFGKAWLEALNLALLAGVLCRSLRKPCAAMAPGIHYCAKTVLNTAIVLLGASFSLTTVLSVGPWLTAGVLGMVLFSLTFTCAVGRCMGLPLSQTLLVACGNSICGNSAIMAAAPVIQAREEDVGSTIAFTAAGGLVVVLGLPLLMPLLNLSTVTEGALAGLTVYAVPQVMGASAPFGLSAIHMGTLVKLVRVLMLGPVCLMLALFCQGKGNHQSVRHERRAKQTLPIFRLLPWYILGFIAMLLLRSVNVLPQPLLAPAAQMATFLTTLAMAALGLSVDVKSVFRASRPLVLTVIVSLGGLISASIALLKIMQGSIGLGG